MAHLLVAATIVVAAAALAVAASAAPPAPIFVTVKASVVERLVAAVLPALERAALNATLPAVVSADINISSIRLAEFHVGSARFRNAAPNLLNVTIRNITFATKSTAIAIQASILKCNGTLVAVTRDASANFSVPLVRRASDGALSVANATGVNVSVGAINVTIDTSGALCQFTADVIEGAIERLETVIARAVVDLIASDALPAVLALLPLPITATPFVDAAFDAMTIPLDASRLLEAKPRIRARFPRRVAPVAAAPVLGAGVAVPDRDFSVVAPASSLNALLLELAARGNLTVKSVRLGNLTTSFFRPYLPRVYSACPNCPLAIDLVTSAAAAPTVSLGADALALVVNGTLLSFVALNGSAGSRVPLFTLAVAGMGGVSDVSIRAVNWLTWKGQVLFWQFTPLTGVTCSVASSSVGSLGDVKVLAWLVSSVTNDILVPLLNEIFQGIPLPVAITRLVAQTTQRVLTLAFDLARV
jgi:hypothetical protein